MENAIIDLPENLLRAGFDELSKAGYDVQHIEDGAKPLELNELIGDDMPDLWKRTEKAIVPKVATLHGGMLFKDGSVFLSPERNHNGIFFNGGWYEITTLRISPINVFLERVRPKIRSHTQRIAVPGRCFSARMEYFHTFGHFMHDILSRIYYEDLGVITPGKDKVIAPPFIFPMQKFLFNRIFSEYEIVEAPGYAALEVEELVIPANLCAWYGFNIKAIETLAKRLRYIMVPYIGPEKYKVCVSRSDSGNTRFGRDFVNTEAFENRMRNMEYMIVEGSKLSLDAQLALWPNVTDLIGVHGSGMMNLLMMPEGGNYTEIAGAPYINIRGETVVVEPLTLRCAIAAGHHVRGIVGIRNKEDQPMIDLEQITKIMLET